MCKNIICHWVRPWRSRRVGNVVIGNVVKRKAFSQRETLRERHSFIRNDDSLS